MTNAALLEVSDLAVHFGGRGRRQRAVKAVNGVDLTVGRGEVVGVVGESGSGKSTLARAILRLVPIERGRILFEGHDVAALDGQELHRVRRRMQMVFQDPYASLDPSMVVEDSIGEPLDIHRAWADAGVERRGRSTWRRNRVLELLETVGLSHEYAQRYPHEFSGGQRQRIAIARALALGPDLLVCDEPVSALDVSTQNQVINLLSDLRERLDIACLFIAHDLTVVRHVSDRIAVMYLGSIVETGPADRVVDAPAHPYTDALLSAVPMPTRLRTRERIVLTGDIPDPANAPRGCPFSTRCVHVMEVCRTAMPDPTPVDGGGTVACHLQTSGPTLRGASLNVLTRFGEPKRVTHRP